MQALNCHPLEISHGTFLPITDLWVTSLNNKYEERTLLQKWGNRSLVPYCFRLCLTQQRWIFIRFLACVWLWMKWTQVLSSCHIVFVVRSDHFHRKSRTQASLTSDIFIKLLIVQWICIWYTKNLLSKLLDLIVKNTKNLCKRLIPSTFLMYRTVINQHTHVWTYSWIFCIIWQPQNSGCHNLLTSHLMANYWQRLEWYTQ